MIKIIKAIIYLFAFIGFVAVVNHQSKAADFNVRNYKDSTDHYIELNGGIEPGDLEKLKTAWLDERIDRLNVELILFSPGGEGNEMKLISKWIQEHEVNTRVLESSKCFSACAVIWTHGKERFWTEGAQVGFHVSSTYGTGVKEFIDAHGYMGFQSYVQTAFKDDILYYLGFNHIPDASTLATNIVQFGYNADNFYILDKKDAVNVTGAKVI